MKAENKHCVFRWFAIYPDDPELVADNLSLRRASLAHDKRRFRQNHTLTYELHIFFLPSAFLFRGTIQKLCFVLWKYCTLYAFFLQAKTQYLLFFFYRVF